ncbi:VanW family protein [Carboxydothermus pertinax]|uniref:VanW family protein n=1 Tax=Carboxydothermus pertinax TaxID=870242 RepID=A0A1L8CU25_9THEO|nr:VanW family protein [Carboxydothermus pertinax]GAV22435.1 VanW family protein [Carboxydothermus pertinax]
MKKLYIILTVVFAFTFMVVGGIVGFAYYTYIKPYEGKIAYGVSVEGKPVGGMTFNEFRKYLQELNDEVKNQKVVFTLGNKSWTYTKGELGISLKTDLMYKRAYEIGRKGFFFKQVLARKQLLKNPVDLKYLVKFDEKLLLAKLNQINKEIYVEPKNAEFRLLPNDTFEIIPHKTGITLDMAQAQTEVRKGLLAKPLEVNLKLKEVLPDKTTEDIKKMRLTGLLSSFTTSFDISKVNRSYNIGVAAGKLNGILVAPGEVFSFNKTVGPRSAKEGYKNAPVILRDQLVEALGGGVCQVSTTLYNAVLLANLPIVERSNHSLPVAYVPPGRDATVTDTGKDLKFKNNLPCYLYIKSYVNGNRITFKIFGDASLRKHVVIKSWVTKTYPYKTILIKDPTLPEGQKVVKQQGINGKYAKAQRVIYENGRVVKVESLRDSYYKPMNKIILVGSKKVPVKTKESSVDDFVY